MVDGMIDVMARWVLIPGISYDVGYVVKQKIQQGMEEAID